MHTKDNQWSPEDEEKLQELISQGIPNKEIAYRLGRTIESIKGKRYRVGPTKKKPWTAEEERELVKMLSHEVIRNIAAKLGRTVGSIEKKTKQLGLHKRAWTLEEDNKLIELLKQEKNLMEIAIQLKRSVHGVEYRSWKLGFGKKAQLTEKLGERTRRHREQELGLFRPR